jgi:anti-sigma factor RsiW
LTAVLSSSADIDCREAEPRLHLYADGELAPEERALLEGHLEACERCRNDLTLLEKTRATLALRAEEEDQAPAALLERIAADTRSAARGERRARLVWAGPLALAGLALVVATVALFTGDRPLAQESPVVAQSVDAHTLDVPVDIATPDARRVEAFLAPRLGVRVQVPRLAGAGLSLVGARVVNAADKRAGQLVYEDGLGARVTLLVVPDPRGSLGRAVAPRDSDARAADVALAGFLQGEVSSPARAADGHAVRLLHDGATLFALVGALSDDRMDRIAQAIAPTLPRARVAGR